MVDTYLYPYSIKEARRRDEVSLWRDSFRTNIACKEAIEAAIRRDFDGAHLKEGCAQSVIAEYGYKRTAFVLANTLREKDYDGRFSQVNRDWLGRTFVPADKEHNDQFVVDSHPAVLDGFITEYRKACVALGLFDHSYCIPGSRTQDYEGRVLVLSPDILKESCWQPENQLWYAESGFGCSPTASGRAVYATCLGDGEKARWDRADFIGVLDEQYLPQWAREKLMELREPQNDSPAIGGMEMN